MGLPDLLELIQVNRDRLFPSCHSPRGQFRQFDVFEAIDQRLEKPRFNQVERRSIVAQDGDRMNAGLSDGLRRVLLEIRNADRARSEDSFHERPIFRPIYNANYRPINGVKGRRVFRL